jgi:hypothetical protein
VGPSRGGYIWEARIHDWPPLRNQVVAR